MREGQAKEKKSIFWKSKGILILGAVLAILLIVIGGSDTPLGKRHVEQSVSEQTVVDPLCLYAQELERKIEALCESVSGVTQARVAVSLVGDFTYVYATDSDTSAADGRTQSSVQYVTVGSGSSEQTVLLTRDLPSIGGIGVVYHGEGDGAVRQELISLISTAFDIGTNKIYITRGNLS